MLHVMITWGLGARVTRLVISRVVVWAMAFVMIMMPGLLTLVSLVDVDCVVRSLVLIL